MKNVNHFTLLKFKASLEKEEKEKETKKKFCICKTCRKEKRSGKGRNLGKKPRYKNIDRTTIDV